MKSILKFSVLTLLTVLLMFAGTGAALADEPEYAPVVPSGISLNHSAYTMAQLQTLSLVATLSPADAVGTISFASSKPSVASVDESGNVKALKDGISIITAKVGDYSAQCTVTVKTVKLKSIKLNKKSLSLSPGNTYTLKASFSPSNNSYKALTWKSSKDSVATVSDKGVVTAVGIGSTKITATALNGVKQTCTVKVSLVKVSSIKLKKTRATIGIGKTLQLSTTISPSTAANKELTYTSSKYKSVATVDENGLVTAIGEGKSVIRVSATDGSKKYATCTVTVSAVRAKSIVLNKTKATIQPEETLQLTATVLPATTTYSAVTWKSSKTAVATVDENGLVTPVAPGTTVITATTDKGKKKATATVIVRSTSYTALTMSFIGDCMLGGDPRSGVVHAGTSSLFEQYIAQNGGTDSVFSNVKSVFQSDDLTFANLEGVLTNSTQYRSATTIVRGKPAYAAMFRNAGIEVVSVANNHAYDCGTAGYNDTVNNLKNAGVSPAGFNTTATRTVNGVKVGVASYHLSGTTASKVKSGITALNKKSDIVIAYLHVFDTSVMYKPAAKTVTIARAAIDAGADIVVGAHNHYLSGIEVYKGKYIVYDLGSFVTCLENPSDKDSMIFQQTFHVYSDGAVEDGGIKAIPVTTSSVSSKNNCQPTLLTGSEATRVIDKLNKLSSSYFTSPAVLSN